jgi:hypothetical protein
MNERTKSRSCSEEQNLDLNASGKQANKHACVAGELQTPELSASHLARVVAVSRAVVNPR